jgi:hypothetical protein
MPFVARLPVALTPRLRALEEEPNFGIFLRGEVGRVTFSFLAQRLGSLKPLLPLEVQALSRCLQAYVDAQLLAGTLGNLIGAETLLEPLGLEDLPLESATLQELAEWLPRISNAEWTTAGSDFQTRAEGNGVMFESRWHQTFIPNWMPDGLDRAILQHAMAYLIAENSWVKANGLTPERLERLLRAR